MSTTFLIGWSLIHFLWQGALVAAGLGLFLALAGNRSPSIRYWVSAVAMLVMAMLPMATALRLRATPGADLSATPAPLTNLITAETAEPVQVTAPAPASESGVTERGATARTSGAINPWLAPRIEQIMPWLVGSWLAGVLALSLRLLGGLAWTRRLIRVGVRPATPSLRETCDRLAARIRLTRPVRVIESTLVRVPAVVGWLRPTLLMPVSLASGLTVQQIEVLLAHELAHVQRHDYAINILQAIIETLLFYHPAVWWVSRQVREEREHCCDDLAVAVTGDSRAYAGALLELEKLRAHDLSLAAAATGGSLVRRIRRLLSPPPAHTEPGQRWVAGALVVAAVLLVSSGSGAAGGAPSEPVASTEQRGPQGAPAPDTVIMNEATGALATRWQAGLAAARRLRFDRFWMGYAVRGSGRQRWLYFDRHAPVFTGGGSIISGHLHFSGTLEGLATGGVPLQPLFGTRPPDDLAILLSFTETSGGPTLERVHLSSYIIPVHFGGQPVLWMGEAADPESVELMRGFYARASARNMKDDLLAVVGAHADARVVVPVLTGWLWGDEPDDLRASAAEWLGHQADAEALAALARAARGDRSSRVRAEAAESVGEVDLPAAADTVIALARTLQDRTARLEAVEALGDRDEPRALDALVSIIDGDPSIEVQREAVETLGDRKDGSGVPHLTQIAQAHPRRDVRYEALETIAHAAPPDEAIALLQRVAQQDPSVEVQRAAIEALGNIEDERATRLLLEIAERHPNPEVRREAVETLGHSASPDQAFTMLARIARSDTRVEVQMEAVETLGELEDQRVVPELEAILRDHPRWEVQSEALQALSQRDDTRAVQILIEVAERHPRADVQREAVESLGQVAPVGDAMRALERFAREHPRPEVQLEAVETLGELRDHEAGVLDGIAELARSHPRLEVRMEAIETYTGHAEAEAAVRFLVPLARSATPKEIRWAALESLADLPDGAGIDAIIEIARTTADRETLLKAIEVLGDSDNPRAISVLENLIRGRT